MAVYLIPATFVFAAALQAFMEDKSTPKTHLDSWVLLVLASLLWPLTLHAIMPRLRSAVAKAGKCNHPAA